jgi:hypothetical protein
VFCPLVIAIVLASCGGAASVPSPSRSASPSSIPDGINEGIDDPEAFASVSPKEPPAPTPRPGSKPTPVPEPPKPSGVRFDEQVQVSDDESTADITQTVTWRAPTSEGVEIKVYGVTECIAEPSTPAPDTSGPCLVEHTPLPASVRTLLASALASDGAVSWTWTEYTGCDIGLAHDPDGPRYFAVVLAAYSASGHSIFAIAEPGGWWQPGPDDIIC